VALGWIVEAVAGFIGMLVSPFCRQSNRRICAVPWNSPLELEVERDAMMLRRTISQRR
jgi:hypothetical protein